jgi:hypothetical protein
MWEMILKIGGGTLVLAILVFLFIVFIALKNHFGWGSKKNKEDHLHWRDRYYSTKKEGL